MECNKELLAFPHSVHSCQNLVDTYVSYFERLVQDSQVPPGISHCEMLAVIAAWKRTLLSWFHTQLLP